MKKWIALGAVVFIAGCSLLPPEPGIEAVEDGLMAVLTGVMNSLEIVVTGDETSAVQVEFASESLDGSATFDGTISMTSTSFLLDGKAQFSDHDTGYLSYSVDGSLDYRQAMTSTGSMLLTINGAVSLQGGDVGRMRFVQFEVEADFDTESYVASSGYVVVDTWKYDADRLF